MGFKRLMLLLLLPAAIAACDSGQPTYSASNANSAPPPPPAAAQQPTPPPAAAPVAQAPAEPQVVAVPAPHAEPPRIKPPSDSATRFAQIPPGQIGPLNKLGVGSCDEYIEHYRTCFNNTKLPREQKFPLRRALMQQVRQWKTDSASGKISQVAAACTDAERKARTEFAQLGCKTF
jgi:hypothetical protein